MHCGLNLIALLSWCDVLINPDKGTMTWFPLHNPSGRANMPGIDLTGDAVVRTKLSKYLDVIFDRSLCFREHTGRHNHRSQGTGGSESHGGVARSNG